MEVVDNLVMWLVPGAMDAGLLDALFWGSMALSLVIAYFAAYPVNKALLRRALDRQLRQDLVECAGDLRLVVDHQHPDRHRSPPGSRTVTVEGARWNKEILLVAFEEVADRNAAAFEALQRAVGSTFDRFIRTTDADHHAAAQEIATRPQREEMRRQEQAVRRILDQRVPLTP